MTQNCPHCRAEIAFEPFLVEWPMPCPKCGARIFVEINEGDEGPTITLYAAEPGYQLYPSKEHS